MTGVEHSIPALLNPTAGSAARAHAALGVDARFRVREVSPVSLADAIRAEIGCGTRRLLVCGGDGTLSAAVGAAAGTALEIAVFPGGTLNHFARDLGIPLDDPAAALDIAAAGSPAPLDLGYVNGHAILNTSSVGVYTEFVQRRDRFEERLSYPLASVAAAARVWHDPRTLSVELLAADGPGRRFETPLVFVGVRERALGRTALGIRRPGGARALHILVVKAATRARIHELALRAAVEGVDALVSEAEIECYLTMKATVMIPPEPTIVAVDGELLHLTAPLAYEFVRDAVTVVQP